MPFQEPRILAAGIERVAFERLAPELRRDTLEVDWVATPEAGVDLAVEKRYDVIIMDAEPCDWPLAKVVREFRSADSPSRDAAIMILAKPNEVDAARALKSHGINRVMLVSDPPQIIREQMSTLLAVAPRTAIRLPTKLETALGNTGRELFCQTENLSTSGMFVKTRHRPQLGSTVVFRIHLTGDSGTVFGRGKIVRHSSPTEEKLDGVAIRFLSFASDGAQRLQDYLENLTNELEPEPESLQSHSSQPEKGPRCKPEDKVILELE